MAKKKVTRKIKKTLLAVGEGISEKAFLQHLKSIYSKGDPKITVVTAGGKGPSNIIKHAISCVNCDGYDRCIVLLDTDLPWPSTLVKQAKSKGIILVGADPCLEGLLLDILTINKCNTNKGCKEKLHPLLSGASTSKDSYQTLFTASALNESRKVISQLDVLISEFS